MVMTTPMITAPTTTTNTTMTVSHGADRWTSRSRVAWLGRHQCADGPVISASFRACCRRARCEGPIQAQIRTTGMRYGISQVDFSFEIAHCGAGSSRSKFLSACLVSDPSAVALMGAGGGSSCGRVEYGGRREGGDRGREIITGALS
jgi:hypothetical protein